MAAGAAREHDAPPQDGRAVGVQGGGPLQVYVHTAYGQRTPASGGDPNVLFDVQRRQQMEDHDVLAHSYADDYSGENQQYDVFNREGG